MVARSPKLTSLAQFLDLSQFSYLESIDWRCGQLLLEVSLLEKDLVWKYNMLSASTGNFSKATTSLDQALIIHSRELCAFWEIASGM